MYPRPKLQRLAQRSRGAVVDGEPARIGLAAPHPVQRAHQLVDDERHNAAVGALGRPGEHGVDNGLASDRLVRFLEVADVHRRRMQLPSADGEGVELDLVANLERQWEELAFVDLAEVWPAQHVVELHSQRALLQPVSGSLNSRCDLVEHLVSDPSPRQCLVQPAHRSGGPFDGAPVMSWPDGAGRIAARILLGHGPRRYLCRPDVRPLRVAVVRIAVGAYARTMRRTIFEEEHEMFRETARAFTEREIVPYHEKWEADGKVDKAMFRKAGDVGLLATAVDERYGGGGVPDFRYNAILNEEIMSAGVAGSGMCMTLHNDVCLPYFINLCDESQAERWMPGLCSGELMSAIAMTEPGIGSDLASMSTTAIRSGDGYVVNGSKTFITNGINSDLVIVAAKTDPSEKHRGMSLIVLSEGMEGFERGRNLDKLGLKSQDTAELFFDDVFVPEENLLGGEGNGFTSLVRNLPQERLSIAVTGVAHAQAAFDWTVDYVGERQAFGQTIASFQNTRFELAEMKTELDIAWVFVDRQIEALNEGELTATDAAEAKWWVTEMQLKLITRCLQLFGGYGFMSEYPISKAYADARVQTIYGGTTEIMKEIIGREVTGTR